MFVFTPCISGSFSVAMERMKKEYRWWFEDSIIYHPALMVSYGMKFLIEDNNVFWKIGAIAGYDLNKVLVLGDSGGFEIFSRKITIPVEEVMEWQFNNANVIFALDMPPRGFSGLVPAGDWEKMKEYTRKNTEALINYASKRSVENKKIYGIVHGAGVAELDDWWKDVAEPYIGSLDGIAYAPRPPRDPNAVMLTLAHAYTKGLKNVHLLAISGTLTLIPIVYWEEKFNLLTADSSSFTKVVGRGRIYTPIFMASVKIGKKGKKHVNNYDMLHCPCPACSYARKHYLKSTFDLRNVDAYAITYLHNLFWILSYIDGLRWMRLYSIKRFKEHAKAKYQHAKGVGWKPASLDFMDCVEETGDLEKCYLQYMPYFEEVSVKKVSTSRQAWW